jgi:arylsulfatase
LTPNDEVKLKVEFNKSALQGAKAGLNAAEYGNSTLGEVQLSITIKGTPVSDLETTWELGNGEDWTKWGQEWVSPNQFLTQPSKFALSGEGFNIGRDAGQPVSQDYAEDIPYEFEGAILEKVVVTIKNDAPSVDPAKEFQGMLWRD